MPKPNPALLPRPAAVRRHDRRLSGRQSDRAHPLEQIELGLGARREISQEGFERLAAMLCRTGQLIPCTGHRPNDDGRCWSTTGSDATSPRRPATSSPAARGSRPCTPALGCSFSAHCPNIRLLSVSVLVCEAHKPRWRG